MIYKTLWKYQKIVFTFFILLVLVAILRTNIYQKVIDDYCGVCY